ncbi:FAD binding domain-containing protein [Clostridium swellfunianum]|uniref:FAD binding domain-containing protein n=1 Tax=Clostridium swellfunianum TaxID=1367462 RepID=UPI002030E7A9|nr:FAD binding domain-containing protein [Clostridium swellfunianum]MCM0650646.1 FAD binding domain-containing protein [Clostridium swellfunianum]
MDLIEVFQPETLQEAKELLNNLSKVKLLAGGTDLIIDLNKNKTEADYLVDLTKIEELKKIKDFAHHIIIGSMATFTDILENDIFINRFTCLRDCSELMGSPQIRNRATIGGNIINGAAAADIVPCLMSLNAVLIIESISTRRLVRCDDYFLKHNQYKIESNELLVGIILNDRNELSGFYKLGKRNSLSIARLSASISFNLVENKLHNIKVALGAVGKHPFRAYELEYLAHGKDYRYLLKRELLDILEERVYRSIKDRPTLPFKREAVKGVYTEAVKKALAKGGVAIE